MQGLVGDGWEQPDHALLELNHRTVMVYEPISDDHEKNTVNNQRCDFSAVSDSCMATTLWGQVCEELIDQIENIANAKAQVDIYTELCPCIFNEMNNHIKASNQMKTMRKK